MADRDQGMNRPNSEVLEALSEVIDARKNADSRQSYVASLHAKGLNAISAKVLEEANETVEAAENGDVDQVVYETADLWFHSMVLLSYFDVSHQHVLEELVRRFGVSGITEKNSRD